MNAGKLLVLSMMFANLAPSAALAQADDLFAGNLGIYYAKVPYGDGTFGARLTRPPVPGSPAAQLQLEPGDTIFMLDGVRFREPSDVLNHVEETSVVFINVRTNQPQSADVTLPAASPDLNPAVHVQPGQLGTRPGSITQPELRRIVSEELRGGHVKYKAPSFQVVGSEVYWKLGEPDILLSNAGPAVYAQFRVEIIRLTRSEPRQRAFWEPYLQRIERVIAEQLAKAPAIAPEGGRSGNHNRPQANDTPPGPNNEVEPPVEFDWQDNRIERIFEEAMQANAAAVGRTARQAVPTPERGIYSVTLTTPSGQGRIYIMPRTAYRIRAFHRVSLTDFQECAPGISSALTGEYVYMVRYSDGPGFLEPHTPLASFRVDRDGTMPLR